MKKKPNPQPAALVTGAAKRIGRAICLKLSSLGYAIALHYHHSKKEVMQLAEEIGLQEGVCEIFPCDLEDPEDASLLIKNVSGKFPDLNLLVNNASIFEKSTLRTATNDSLKKHLAVNFQTPFILTRDFTNICKNGHIINILDTNIVKNRSAHVTYLLSKKTLYELTKLAALELAPDIRVNSIAPGFILPPVDKNHIDLKRLTENIPLKRKGEVEQITQSIEFLLNNPYLTGQIIFNDGGEHLT